MWDLSSPARDQTWHPFAVEAWRFNHWIAREAPERLLFTKTLRKVVEVLKDKLRGINTFKFIWTYTNRNPVAANRKWLGLGAYSSGPSQQRLLWRTAGGKSQAASRVKSKPDRSTRRARRARGSQGRLVSGWFNKRGNLLGGLSWRCTLRMWISASFPPARQCSTILYRGSVYISHMISELNALSRLRLWKCLQPLSWWAEDAFQGPGRGAGTCLGLPPASTLNHIL